jgi:hypothetical protein
MKKIVCAIVPTLVIAFVLGGISGSAAAQDNTTYAVNYYSNANTSGAPDATLRVINDGDTGGTLCAAFYVFDDSEEMQECCSCPVTADGVIAESLNKYLLANSLTSVVNHKGVIKLVSTNAPSGTCDPRVGAPTAGIRAWSTHIQAGVLLESAPVPSRWFITEAELHNSNLIPSELGDLQQFCWFEIALGMGHGICACGQEDQAF